MNKGSNKLTVAFVVILLVALGYVGFKTFNDRNVRGDLALVSSGTSTLTNIPKNPAKAPLLLLSVPLFAPGGNEFIVGDTLPIMWYTENIIKDAVIGIEILDTRYSEDSPQGKAYIGGVTNSGKYIGGVPNMVKYDWKIPARINDMVFDGGSVYKLRIKSSYGMIAGNTTSQSNGRFSILKQPPTNFSMKLTNPADGVSVRRGEGLLISASTVGISDVDKLSVQLYPVDKSGVITAGGKMVPIKEGTLLECSKNECGFVKNPGMRIPIPKTTKPGEYKIKVYVTRSDGSVVSDDSVTFKVKN